MKEKRLEDIQRAANLQESARLHSVRQHRQIAGVFSNPDIHVISKTFDYLRVLEIPEDRDRSARSNHAQPNNRLHGSVGHRASRLTLSGDARMAFASPCR